MEEKLNVHQKWHNVMKAVKTLSRDSNVKYTGKGGQVDYKAMSADKVLGIVRPIIEENGLNVTPEDVEIAAPGRPMIVVVKYRVTDVLTGDHFFYKSAGASVDTADKGPGIAMTYAHKTGFLKALNIPCGYDADDVSSLEIEDKNRELQEKCISHYKAAGANMKEADKLGGVDEALRTQMTGAMKQSRDLLEVGKLRDFEEMTAIYRENLELVAKRPEGPDKNDMLAKTIMAMKSFDIKRMKQQNQMLGGK